MQIRWPDLGCFVRGIELGGHICMRTRPLQQLPMVPSRPQSAVLQLSFRCLSKCTVQIRWPDLGCFVRGIELGGHICMRTRPLQQLPMVPSRPQSAVLQLSFRCLSKVVLPQKGRQPARPGPWVTPNPDLMCVCTTTTRPLFQSVLSNHWEPCVQTSPRWDPWVIYRSSITKI